MHRTGRVRLTGAMLLALALLAGHAQAAVPWRIAAGPAGSAPAQAAADLARFVAVDAGVRLDVVPAPVAADALARVGSGQATLAIVQADVLQDLLERADRGDIEAARIARPLRVVVPVFGQEMHFIVRADGPMQFIDQIRGARINVGPAGGGAALTVDVLHRILFDEPVAPQLVSHLSNEDALRKLVTDRSVDVVAFVDGAPARLLAGMTPASRRFVRVLRFAADRPASAALLQAYTAATLRASRYPNLLDADVPALAVPTYLVANDTELRRTPREAARFAEMLCRRWPRLASGGHPKWAELGMELPDLVPGAFYEELTARILADCTTTKPARP